MSWEIVLDDKEYSFTTDDLPALIHGEKESGHSRFTATALSELYHQGHPVFLIVDDTSLSEEFLSLTAEQDEVHPLEDSGEFEKAETKQIVVLAKDQISLLPKALTQLPDFWKRIVVISGIEHFSEEEIRTLKDHPYVIYSGDLNSCPAKEALLQLKYNAKIFFSPLHNDYRLTLPQLEENQGYFLGRISQGKISRKAPNSS